jgi:hypothetical protein
MLGRSTYFIVIMAVMLAVGAGAMSSCAQRDMRSTGRERPDRDRGRPPGGEAARPLPGAVEIPGDGSAPRTGAAGIARPSRIVTFSQIGQRVDVRTGEVVNLVYDGIDPETSYLRYEATDGGYMLELTQRNEYVTVTFAWICQIFVVDNPANCTVVVPEELRFEQIVWTPRADGLWEVRAGNVNRGCKSEALDSLGKLRTRAYEANIPRKGRR